MRVNIANIFDIQSNYTVAQKILKYSAFTLILNTTAINLEMSHSIANQTIRHAISGS